MLAPVTRPASSREAKVSGSPPWEPAVKPDSELPWAKVPAPQAITGRGTANLPRPASRSAGDSAVAAGGLSGSGHADEAETSNGRGGGAGGDDHGADADAPIYTWNPGATTETFPSVPRDEG